MKKLFIIPALIVTLCGTIPLQALSAEPEIANILSSLNKKTDKVKVGWQEKNNSQETVSDFREVNSYVFSVEDGKKLKIELEEKVEKFDNDKLSRSHHTKGIIVFDTTAIDPSSPVYNNDMIEIHCKENKNCAKAKVVVTRINNEIDKSFSNTNENPTFMFLVRGHYNLEKDKPIFNDLQKLISLLTTPKPEDTSPSAEKEGK